MTANMLRWHDLSREAIPGVLLGVEQPVGPAEGAASVAPSKQGGDITIGVDSPERGARPVVALVSSNKLGELFAWLHTFSSETFPISQFCRVETHSRWASVARLQGPRPDFDAAVWASIVVGEMLANAENRPELKAVPLSWAGGCFSFTMARVFRGAGAAADEVREAASRLRTIEADSRLAARRVSVDALSVLWTIASNGAQLANQDIRELLAVVLTAVSPQGALILQGSEKLVSSSAEQRIHGFDQFVDRVLAENQKQAGSADRRTVGALIAGAALLAGNGTSHIELLKPYADEFPDALPWFGLFAGLAGPRAWDADWLRLVKGVERQVRAGFQLTDPLQCDLCWIEFDWLRLLSKAPSVFIDLPKLHNRLLTVEVFPGATYQSRVVVPAAESKISAKGELKNDLATKRPAEAQPVLYPKVPNDIVAQLERVSVELQAVLGRLSGGASSQVREKQPSLFEAAPPPQVTRRTAGRGKKSTAVKR